MAEVLPRFDCKVSCGVAEDQGRVRQSFEDAHLAAPDLSLFIVADGIGGHKGGEVASRIAIDAAHESFRSERTQAVLDAYAGEPTLERRRMVLGRLRRCVERAHEAVQKAVQGKADLVGMGTTLDIVCLLRNKALIAHVGDGRVYLARSHATLQLTQDHTDFALMKARGQLRPGARSDRAQRLVHAVGLGESASADLLCIELGHGDRLLLCSDGVHGQLHSEGELSEILRQGSAAEAAQALVAAVSAQGRDNATALVLDVEDTFVKRPAGDRGLSAADVHALQTSVLLSGLPESALLLVLTAAVELECTPGDTIGQAVANDVAAYLVLDGLLELPGARMVSTGALLFAESLVGVASGGALPSVLQPTRLLRIRQDDFGEVCKADPMLGVELYKRLAEHLARSTTSVSSPSTSPPP